jgi:hypothetical protein
MADGQNNLIFPKGVEPACTGSFYFEAAAPLDNR